MSVRLRTWHLHERCPDALTTGHQSDCLQCGIAVHWWPKVSPTYSIHGDSFGSLLSIDPTMSDG